jgi:hypothetical protein
MSTDATDAPTSARTSSADRIVLTLPGSPSLRGVATLVLGGIGSRIDLPYEKVDELQLAVLSVLTASDVESATIEVEVEDATVVVSVGPLPQGTSATPGLQAVLERLVDAVTPSLRGSDEVRAEWLTLRLTRPPGA